PNSPAATTAGRTPSASYPPSSSAPPSNPHSARCPAGAQPPTTSCLGAFWTPAATARGRVRHAGVQKPAHDRTDTAQQTSPFDHLVCDESRTILGNAYAS